MIAALPSHPIRRYYASADALFELTVYEPRPRPVVSEALVHDLWRHRRYAADRLRTLDGRRVTVLDAGRANQGAGPDFLGAALRIDALTWHGDVEIHTTSQGWEAHQHARDPRYNQVVLHVALFADGRSGHLRRPDGTVMPEVILADALEQSVRSLLYAYHHRPSAPILCAAHWPALPASELAAYVRSLARQRVEARVRRLREAVASPEDLDQVLYTECCTALGQPSNARAMQALSLRVPLDVLQACGTTLEAEALLLGEAGLLDDVPRTEGAGYPAHLGRAYEALSTRREKAPALSWQYARVRPASFPPRRLAQVVALFVADGPLARRPARTLLHQAGDASARALTDLLRVAPSPFWMTHYRPTSEATAPGGRIGRSTASRLLINAVVPVLGLAALLEGRPGAIDRAVAILDQLPPEQDRITKRFAQLGFDAASALDTQGLHELFKRQCEAGGCLDCRIGRAIVG